MDTLKVLVIMRMAGYEGFVKAVREYAERLLKAQKLDLSDIADLTEKHGMPLEDLIFFYCHTREYITKKLMLAADIVMEHVSPAIYGNRCEICGGGFEGSAEEHVMLHEEKIQEAYAEAMKRLEERWKEVLPSIGMSLKELLKKYPKLKRLYKETEKFIKLPDPRKIRVDLLKNVLPARWLEELEEKEEKESAKSFKRITLGFYMGEDGIIAFREIPPPENTFIHELIHAGLHMLGVKDSALHEPLAESFANFIISSIKNSKDPSCIKAKPIRIEWILNMTKKDLIDVFKKAVGWEPEELSEVDGVMPRVFTEFAEKLLGINGIEAWRAEEKKRKKYIKELREKIDDRTYAALTFADLADMLTHDPCRDTEIWNRLSEELSRFSRRSRQ